MKVHLFHIFINTWFYFKFLNFSHLGGFVVNRILILSRTNVFIGHLETLY